jgi:hypothetical protein
MANDKAQGQTGLTTDMIKNLPPQAKDFYVELIQEFWKNKEVDFESWHAITLNMIYKGKGDPQDLNNHRGIALKETLAKVLSIVIVKCLLLRLKAINPTSQFGHLGCQEALHTVKRVLLLHWQHGLESYTIFIDLVKAFDTAHHNLLFCILEKYGLPPLLVQKITKLYKNCNIKIKVRKKSTAVDYTTGVHLGDNMSPVLFLFIIQAFSEMLKINAQPIIYSYFPENKNGNLKTLKGRLLSQNTSAKGHPFNFRSSFYVDDSFFVFQNHDKLQQAAATLNDHFKCFGLIMHVGSTSTKSKSKAMYFLTSLTKAQDQQ